jgi:hypothetical protein
MNVALWIAAGVLATVLLISTAKAFVPREKIQGWAGDPSDPGNARGASTASYLFSVSTSAR